MKLYRNLFKVILIVLMVGSLHAQSKPEVIKIDPKSKTNGTLGLSDLVESVEYVPLETTAKCLVGILPREFDVSKNYIVLNCWKTNQIYLFRRNGSFVCLVGGGGLGPGEYSKLSITGVFIDEEKKQILVGMAYPNQLTVYDLKGKFIKKYPVGKDDKVAHFMAYHANKVLLTYPNSGTVPFLYELRSPELTPIKEGVKAVPFEQKNTFVGFSGPFAYLYDGCLHVSQPNLNDTLYKITNQQQFVPKYVINGGQYEVTPELRSDGEELWKQTSQLISHLERFETKEHLLISYLYQRKQHFTYYSKQNKTLRYFSSEKGIPNDFDGGPSVWPVVQKEDIWYAFQDASALCGDEVQPNKLKPKGPATAVQALKKLSKKLEPDDNPVLMILKRKE